MRYLSITSKSLAIAALAIGLGSQTASAVQYKTILQTGQSVPGNDQPLTWINAFGVDAQQNVVASITTQGAKFNGLYRISANAQPQRLSGGDNNFFDFPSVSLGTVGYFESAAIPGDLAVREELKFGQPGNVKTLLTVKALASFDNGGRDERPSSLAVVNGQAFFIANQPAQFGQPELRGLVQFQNNQLSVILKPDDPIFLAGGNPPLTLNGSASGQTFSDRPPIPVRASSETLLLSRSIDRGFQVFERPNGSRFRKIYEGATGKLTSSFSCGIAASRSNVVVCTVEGPNNSDPSAQFMTKLLLRTGRDGQFKEIKFPKITPTDTVENPAISGTAVAFVVTKTFADDRTALYISNNAAAPKRLIGTGDKLNGNVIRKVELATNGQSIGNGFLLFKATFADGSQTLYKAVL